MTGLTTSLTSGCIHDTAVCQTGCQTGLTTGCIVYRNIYPVVKLATIDMSRKLGLCPIFVGRGARAPSNTMWPGPRPIPAGCMPSLTLMHPTFWPQYTNVTDRQDRKRSDSKGRLVLETVARKLLSPLSYLRLKCIKFDFDSQTPLGELTALPQTP